MSANHLKHPKLAKPTFQQYGRHEIGILGAPCSIIESLSQQIYDRLNSRYQIAYIDADHGSGDTSSVMPIYKDMISYHRYDHNRRLNSWEQKQALRTIDLAIVNSNHFDAKSQLVIVHPDKEESLKRKIDRLTDVKAILMMDGVDTPYEFIYDHVTRSCPVINLTDVDAIASLVTDTIEVPSIMGLVLAGGKSSRMGTDKSQIKYHNDLTQEEHMAAQVSGCASEVYLSKRSAQDIADHIIVDSFAELGPFGAILSAFRSDPNVAWLVAACDQPLLREEHLKMIVEQRDPSKVATCFYNPETDFPEPLITLWEPKAYPIMLQYLALGNSCPRKVLINSDINMIRVSDTSFMRNVNTPEERKLVEKELA